ncbi:type II 3-dehydroquinate dehydratase [Alkalihalobacillus sp. LMS39]|uniref:type II 3-dehydroquinate dehydratase n=1 Tax=Alkalihalobacillus sp. LMS39 TaxID=2924032 RepID=UPI001FB2A738|nr:type II 3-dehydroquinate dehydratase [Alkalihalobacillus sp. LMS39]UOE95910.1 type II 3-dehydroquinate dehydratase [Alkalihalobacillus sp. LMS39]
MKKLLVVNGPNLNRLGLREPEIYGRVTLAELEQSIIDIGKEHEFEITCRQSNHEGDIIDWIHKAQDENVNGIILNPAAFTHYSYAIRDAIASIDVPVIEVHISNVHKREEFRHTSVTAPVTTGQIVGFGLSGYKLAVLAFKERGKQDESN